MNIIDIHCHPALKINLFGHHVYLPHLPLHDTLPTGMAVDLHFLKKVGVNAIVSVQYLPEKELKTGLPGIGKLLNLPLDVCKKIGKQFEDVSTPSRPFEQILQMIDVLESDLKAARDRGFKVNVARNLQEMAAMMAAGNTVFIHSIEGGNCLGTAAQSQEQIEAHIDKLWELGVCQFTIAHFFENILVASQGGIPPFTKKHMGMAQNTNPNPLNKGLSDLGKIIVTRMFDKGIIIDLVHCPPEAWAEIFAINDARGANRRPLVFSHAGLKELVQYMTNQHDIKYLPGKPEVLKIKECGGVIGVIFMNYWLNGKEEDSFLQYNPGIGLVIATIQQIAAWCGTDTAPDYSFISIGSDLDGFTETPDDLYTSAKIKKLITAMRNANISEADIEKICFDNYKRVLQKGWH